MSEKITNLTEATSSDNANDFLVIVDVSDTTQATTGTNKKIHPSNLGISAASPLTTKGDLYTYDTADARLPVGSNGYELIADSLETTGVKWRLPAVYNVKDHNIKGDGLDYQDGAINVGVDATAFSSTNATFTSADVGKVIAIKGAGTSGAYHVTTIAGFTDANNVTLTDAAATTVSSATFFYGTDDTANINTLLTTVHTAGGGVLFFPVGIYVINGALQNTTGVNENCQIVIPQVDGTDLAKPSIMILGEIPPNFRQSGGIGSGRTDDSGTIFRSTIQGSGTEPSVIGNVGATANILQMSFTNFFAKNISIHPLPDANNKITIGGINCYDSKIAVIENVICHPYALNLVDSGEPDVIDVIGIALPRKNCEHQTMAIRCNVGGYTTGYKISDHGNLYDVSAICCSNGIEIEDAAQTAYINKAVVHWCINSVTISGSEQSNIDFEFLMDEGLLTGGKWYEYQYTINDASNYGHGQVKYSIVEANVGLNNSLFRKNGGLELKCLPIGNDLDNEITTNDTMERDWFNIPNIYNQATDATLTIPAWSDSFAPNIGDKASFITKAAGNLQFVEGTGAVNIRTQTASFLQTNGQYSKAVLEVIAQNEYHLSGDLQLYTGSTDWTSDLISYWKFNDNGTDDVGSNNATMTNVTYSAGKSGNAAELNGTTTDIEVADNVTLSFGNGTTDSAVSWSGFFYFDILGSGDGLFGKRESGSQFEYQLRYQSGALEFTMFDRLAATNFIRASYTWSPSTSTWYHIIVTYSGNGAHSGVTFYIDGSDVGALTNGSVNEGSYVAMDNGTASLNIGNIVNATANEMDGRVDGFGIWSIELNSTQANDIYTQQNGGSELVP